MKKKQLFLSLLMITSLFSAVSCGNGGGNNEPSDIAWSEGRTFLDESKLSGEVKKTTTIRVHYTRLAADYDGWDIWAWQSEPEGLAGAGYSFSMYDAYGVISDIELSKVGPDIKTMGIIIRQGGDSWSGKDIEKDRFISIPETTSDGIYDVYMTEGREMIYENREDANKETILSSYASFIKRGEQKLTAFAYLSCEKEKLSADRVSFLEDGKEITGFTVVILESSKAIQLVLPEGFEYDFAKEYRLRYDFGDGNVVESKLAMYDLYNTKAFGDKYNYYGDDLGVTFSANKLTTTFKLWAPISEKVVLNIYDSGTKSASNKPTQTIEMTKGDKGVWSTTVESYLHGKYYTYSVTNSGKTNEVVDPYAKSAGINGKIGMVVDFDVINEELDWDSVVRPNTTTNNVDASIYEMHVRDMTIDSTSGVSAKNRGKYLGLTESGTTYTKDGKTVTTGLDHLKELGISHVQILPFYDINSVDESGKGDQYNWGYDPLNYNVLEGSYSTDPTDGLVRIREFKQMMKTLLANNIQVNMDVVYNHTAGLNDTNFELIIPGYYHRLNSSFDFSNGSGCGNEMATDHYMYRKFVVDSCKFWLSEYKLSGYRFDLMGLIDTETMAEVYKECAAIYDKVMVYGEPWTGGSTPLSSLQQTNQSTVNDIEGIVGAFNDKIRNAIKGDNSPGTGWVQGDASKAAPIRAGLEGKFSGSIDPNKVINYVSCHDNYTLFDHLDLTLTGSRKTNLNDVYKQCEALVFTGQGIAFMQEGEDFMRSKQAGTGSQVHNSYNAGDKVNKMDYSLKVKNFEMFEYFKDLIQVRKENPLLRLGSRDAISAQMQFVGNDNKVLAFTVADPSTGEELYVIHSLDAVSGYSLGGSYKVILDHSGKVASSGAITTIDLKANDSIILKKA